jgi:hypothetical protein
MADHDKKLRMMLDKLALEVVTAATRLPASMLTEKLDALKTGSNYMVAKNKGVTQEEGDAIEEFRTALGISGAPSPARGGSPGPGFAARDDADGGPGDDDADDSPDAGEAVPDSPEPAPGVPGPLNGAGGPLAGPSVADFRHSVRLPDGE